MIEPKKRITVCLKMSARDLNERFGADLRTWISGAKVKVVGPDRWVALQSPHFQKLGISGCWALAATLHLPIVTIDMREAFA